jgi:hypothetical protein
MFARASGRRAHAENLVIREGKEKAMLKSIKYSIWPKKLNFADSIESVVNTIEREFKLHVTPFKFRDGDSTYIVHIDDNEDVRFEKYNKFIEYFKTIPQFISFECNISFSKRMTLDFAIKGLWIRYSISGIEITCHSDNHHFVERAHEITRGILNLAKVERHDPDEYRWKYLDPTIFISRHFDDIGNSYYSDLSLFLSLLGFSVNQGEEYVSGLIPDKVKHRIDTQDITVVVVSGDRSHDWLIAEIGYAEGKGKHIILLKEKGLPFNTTIIGKDYEYMEFEPGHIQEVFSKLLREFRSIRIKGLF